MLDNLTKALAAADRDWRNNVGEHDRASLDRMFVTSGFARQAPRDPDGKVPDWCGMAVGTWLVLGGMNPAFARSFLHCRNVEAFFTYGGRQNVNPKRLDTKIQLESKWSDIRKFHGGPGSDQSRVWLGRDRLLEIKNLGACDYEEIEPFFQAGDVVLFDWSARDDADHIAMVKAFDGRTLITIEGNASGFGPDGKRRRDAVVERRLDLGSRADASLIYGFGRLSPMDFCTNAVKP